MMYISGAKAENVTERKSTVEINSSVTKDSTQPLNLAKEEVLRGKSVRTDIRAGAEAETVGGAEEGIEPEVRVEIGGYRNQTAGIAVEAGAEAELETGTQAGAGAEMITTGEDMSTTAEVRAVDTIRAGAGAETVGGAEEGIEPEVRVEIGGYRNQTAGIAVEAGAEAELETGTQAGAGAEMITTGEDMSTTAEVQAVEREHSVAEKGATEGMNEVPF